MTYPLTIVSGYWPVENKYGDKYKEYFQRTLQLDCPYVFFGTKESIELVKPFRGSLPTTYIECGLDEFYTRRYKEAMFTDSVHCPSKELNMIWNEKLFFIQKAAALNPYGSEFYAWVDAGLTKYRDEPLPTGPFPNREQIAKMPHNKFIYTSSSYPYNARMVRPTSYYHHISGVFCLHRSFIDTFVELFKEYLAKYIPRRQNIYTDQVIYTYIYQDFPGLFHKVEDGYSMLIEALR
jgi:hypothetical protein